MNDVAPAKKGKNKILFFINILKTENFVKNGENVVKLYPMIFLGQRLNRDLREKDCGDTERYKLKR